LAVLSNGFARCPRRPFQNSVGASEHYGHPRSGPPGGLLAQIGWRMLDPCAFRKSHPDILMVQPAKDRVGDDGSDVLDSPQKRRVLL